MDSKELLALQRSHLANERTVLAYFRTFIVLLSSGIAIMKLDLLKDIRFLGFSLLFIAPMFLLLGIYRFKKTEQKLIRITSKKKTTNNSKPKRVIERTTLQAKAN